MTTKKQKPETMSVYNDKRAFFPCELTVGSTIQLDGWTAETDKDRNGEIIITDSDPIYTDLVTATIRFTNSQKDKRKPLVCKVRNIVAACSGFGNYFDINYLVETDLEYNECEKGVFITDQFHSFNIVHVTQILERANTPVKYKWFNNCFTDSYVSKLLFALSPGTAFNLVKIIEYAKKQGVCWTPKGELPNVHVGKNKRFKKFIKQNINRFKHKDFLHTKFVMEDVDDIHGLTTDDGDCDYVDYD